MLVNKHVMNQIQANNVGDTNADILLYMKLNKINFCGREKFLPDWSSLQKPFHFLLKNVTK